MEKKLVHFTVNGINNAAILPISGILIDKGDSYVLTDNAGKITNGYRPAEINARDADGNIYHIFFQTMEDETFGNALHLFRAVTR